MLGKKFYIFYFILGHTLVEAKKKKWKEQKFDYIHMISGSTNSEEN